ncbi:hypothetical protein AB0L59_03370 [Streptomyces sp. NPDC052109]|uniref:hypothetical protein n=1 Tax=Streptomyces sp. NPDC052109 TaxID=3155527 RepID=UPI00342440C8
MRLDPRLTPAQREPALKIQAKAEPMAYGMVLGIPLTFDGAHFGITRQPLGFVAALAGLGLLVLLSLAAAGWLLYEGADRGAYGNSLGFGALMPVAALPFGMALAAVTTFPQLLQVIPAGAKVGRSLYSIIFVLATTVTGEGIKGHEAGPVVAGGATLLICGGAMAPPGKAAKGMRDETP